jgi:hypothetical protein
MASALPNWPKRPARPCPNPAHPKIRSTATDQKKRWPNWVSSARRVSPPSAPAPNTARPSAGRPRTLPRWPKASPPGYAIWLLRLAQGPRRRRRNRATRSRPLPQPVRRHLAGQAVDLLAAAELRGLQRLRPDARRRRARSAAGRALRLIVARLHATAVRTGRYHQPQAEVQPVLQARMPARPPRLPQQTVTRNGAASQPQKNRRMSKPNAYATPEDVEQAFYQMPSCRAMPTC